MATRVEVFQTTVAALGADIVDFNFGQDNGTVSRIEVVFPDGCAGLVDLVIMYGGQQVIPYQTGETLRGNNETVGFDDLDDYPTGNSWEMGINNADIAYAHRVTVKFYVSPFVVDQAELLPPILLLPLAAA